MSQRDFPAYTDQREALTKLPLRLYGSFMKISRKLILAGIFATAATSGSTFAQSTPPAPTPPVSVFKGVGVKPEAVNVPSVTLDILPANAARGQTSPGALVVNLKGPGRGAPAGSQPFRVSVDINIYSIDPQGNETLVTQAKNVPKAPGPAVIGEPAIHALRLDDRAVFAAPLRPGRYRAEAILTSWTPPISTTTGLTSDPVPVEAGGAALNFNLAELFIAQLANFSGEIRTTARLTLVDPRQAPNAAAAAKRVMDMHVNAIRTWVGKANAPIPGTPPKAPIVATETPIPAPGVSGISVRFQGQLYADTVAQSVAQLQTIASAGNRGFPVPGGILHLSTTLPISVTPAAQ